MSEATTVKQQLIYKRRRSLIQVIQFNRCLFRGYFGESFADKWGFFVDRNMSTEIHSYLDWVEYPMGDFVLEGHSEGVRCVAVTPDGYHVFTGSEDGEIIKWDLLTNELMTRFDAHSEGVFSLAHTQEKLFSAGGDGKIKVWNSEDCSLIRTMDGHEFGINSLSLNKRGTILVSGSGDETCRVWSVESGECLSVMKGHSDRVNCVLFADDVILSGSSDKSIRFWDPDTGKKLRKIRDGIRKEIYDLSLNCDSSMLACCYYGGFTLFKYPSMEVMTSEWTKTYRCCFHPSNPSWFAVSTGDNSIRVNIAGTSDTFRILQRHAGLIHCLRFSPDGYRLISVSYDMTVRVWQLAELN